MVQVRSAQTAPSPVSVPSTRYVAGGQIAVLHAELAERLAVQPSIPGAASPLDDPHGPAFVRSLSVAGGYVALALGYAAVLAAAFY